MTAIPFLLRLIAVALGLGFSQWTSDAVSFDSGAGFGFAVLLLAVVLTLLKPVLVLLMLPFVVLTLGAGLWVVNALLVMLTSYLVPGFLLTGWGGAFWAALWVSLLTIGTTCLAGRLEPPFRKVVVRQRGFRPAGVSPNQDPSRKSTRKDDDVIDI